MNTRPSIPRASSAMRASGATGLIAALLAATCCILPLALMFAGVAGAGLMMTMMQYEWITLPLGVFGLAGAWWIYFRRKRRCETEACQFVGRRLNQVLLGIATVVVIAALLLKLFPSWTAALMQSIPM